MPESYANVGRARVTTSELGVGPSKCKCKQDHNKFPNVGSDHPSMIVHVTLDPLLTSTTTFIGIQTAIQFWIVFFNDTHRFFVKKKDPDECGSNGKEQIKSDMYNH